MDDLIVKLQAEKRSGRDFQERKHASWNENYELYRNKIRTNQLVQRQAVNIPLMKETIKTLLSKIDDAPQIDWEEKSGDEYKELVLQEKWNKWTRDVNLEGIDIQDKKTCLLYGRPHKKLNWANGTVTINALDTFDVIVDPQTDPLDLETAHFVIHQNIFRTLREILASPRYSAEGKQRLKNHLTAKQGMVIAGQNRLEWEKKMERLQAMGVNSQDFATFGEGDTIVNMTEHITHIWEKGKFVRYVIVYAEDEIEMLKKPLKEMIGVEFYPYSTWTEDIETQDYFPDAVGDMVRVPNKIQNIWFSQWVESRTLGNFNMHWYAPTANFEPQTYEPGPGRMLPSPPLGPGQKISDVLKPIEMSKLDDNIDALEYLQRMVERATSTTAIDKGVGEERKQTLGEVEILLGKAMERTVAMAKFYRRGWYDLANKWIQLVSANQTKKEELYKTDKNGKVWPKTVYPSDWKSKAGYEPIVRSTGEQEQERTKGMQKLIYIKSLFPVNKALDKVMQQRALEMIDITPAEMKAVQDEQDNVSKQMEQQMVSQEQVQQQGEQDIQQINQRINELNQIQNA